MHPAIDLICAGVALPVRSALPATLARVRSDRDYRWSASEATVKGLTIYRHPTEPTRASLKRILDKLLTGF